MSNEKFKSEKACQITLHIARKLFQDGLLTEDELRIIETMLNKKYAPILGCLYL